MKYGATQRASIILLAALGCACSDATPTERVETIQVGDCPVWATGARCGVFTVPENRAADDGRRVSLAFIVLPALSATPAEPVVYVAGGPGQTLTEIAHIFDFSGLRASRDIVLLDQRGTSIAPRLDCFTTDATDARQALISSFDPSAMALCRSALGSVADLRQYTTIQTIADLEAFRKELGYARVNLMGASYGTRVILEYLRRHPATVRAAVLTSAAPHSFRNPLYHARSAQDALDTLLAACAQDTSCRAQNPTPKEDLAQILARLAAQPASVQINDPNSGMPTTVELTRYAFADALRVLMYSPDGGWSVPGLLRQVASGNYTDFATLAVARLRGLKTGLRHGLLMSVVCTEDVSRISEAEIAPLTNDTFLGDSRVRQQMAACASWPKGEIPSDYGTDVVSAVPTLVISGRYDPVTPPKWGEATVANLSNGRHVVTGGAHSPGSACLSSIMTEFIATANAATVSVACAAGDVGSRRRRR